MKRAPNKKLLLCLCATFLFGWHFACSQEMILLDRKWKQPVQQVDTLTLSLLQNGFFPVYKNDLGKIIAVLEGIIQKQVQQKSFRYLSAPLLVQGTEVVGDLSKGEKNTIFVKTTTGTYITFMPLITGEEGPAQREKKLMQLLDYLKNNRPVLE